MLTILLTHLVSFIKVGGSTDITNNVLFMIIHLFTFPVIVSICPFFTYPLLLSILLLKKSEYIGYIVKASHTRYSFDFHKGILLLTTSIIFK